jgi:anti-anti-sigma regulatory factor
MGAPPNTIQAIAASRVARDAGHIKLARRALDHGYALLGQAADPNGAAEELALESMELARVLEGMAAPVAALGEYLRARDVGYTAADEGVQRLAQSYSSWRPQAQTIGVTRDSLTAGASGAFWIGSNARGRVACLEGGITGDGTEAFTRVLDMCGRDVSWLFLDVVKLSYVGSAGLAVAVKLAERLKTSGGGLSMFAMSSNLKLLVETLGLAIYLNPEDELHGAVWRMITTRAREASRR